MLRCCCCCCLQVLCQFVRARKRKGNGTCFCFLSASCICIVYHSESESILIMIYLIQIRFDRSLALSHINLISIRSQIKSLSQAEYQNTRKPEINYPKYSHISLELLQNDTFTTFFPRQYCLLKGTHIKLSMSTICLLYVSIYHMHPTNTETTTRTTTTNRSLKTEN